MSVVWPYYLAPYHHPGTSFQQYAVLPLTLHLCNTTSSFWWKMASHGQRCHTPEPEIIYEWQCHECNFMNSSDMSIAVFCNHGGWEYDIGSRKCILCYTIRPNPAPPLNDWNKLKPTIILLYLQSADCSCMYLLGLLRFLFLLSFQYPNICVLNTNSSRPLVTHSIHVVSVGLCRACFLQVGGQSMTRHFFAKCTVLPVNLHFP